MTKQAIIVVLTFAGVVTFVQHVAGYGEGFDCAFTDSVPCADATGPYYGTCPNGNQLAVGSTAGQNIDKCERFFEPKLGNCANEGKVTCRWTSYKTDCYGNYTETPESDPNCIPTKCN